VECIDGARACPPEDCGGVWGYEDLLQALKDPSTKAMNPLWSGWVKNSTPRRLTSKRPMKRCNGGNDRARQRISQHRVPEQKSVLKSVNFTEKLQCNFARLLTVSRHGSVPTKPPRHHRTSADQGGSPGQQLIISSMDRSFPPEIVQPLLKLMAESAVIYQVANQLGSNRQGPHPDLDLTDVAA